MNQQLPTTDNSTTDSQNIDSLQNNPLTPTKPEKKQKIKQNTNQNSLTPKNKLQQNLKTILIIFFAIVSLLLFISLINTIKQKSPDKKNLPIPTPTENLIPTTTQDPNEQKEIPEEWQKEFDSIDKLIKSEKEFLPPQIDTTIGL
ncbi:hypothetical protein KKC08_01905 [Patescibacteria group bacterium]|nr:hypothetical protein [Patescibacteria group bacterium]MCG2702348.1 hypothetical protein [Candidatus Parcubacteria bacterium]MBU4264962.1 hypothetical protein [Patescibacteria group bacterium]MBU4389799.1 hypothetical protein [Patescibacteria group bacterium]MBU4396897.1 hypothetical protein [Patescibacteria group bacterium]